MLANLGTACISQLHTAHCSSSRADALDRGRVASVQEIEEPEKVNMTRSLSLFLAEKFCLLSFTS